MEGKNLIREIAKCLPVAHTEYSGNLDTNCLRTGTGDEQWHHDYQQRYRGRFLQDCLHGKGKYSWTITNDRVVYEGMFYANDLEGYGKFSYNDTSVFEGLFKSNGRFGPGVFTYPDGSQDVGMWCGKNLMRLCCVVKPEWVPRLGKSPAAKVKLLKFKKLVSVCNICRERTKGILVGLEVNDDVMKQWDQLYSRHVRNPKSHFFNTCLYDKQYFCEKDCYIEVALSPEEEKLYYEDQTLDKPEHTSKEGSASTGSNPFLPTTNNKCILDPKQIRIDEINLELEHTEEVLTRIRNEINKAHCKKQLALRKLKDEAEIRKSVTWEKMEIIGGDVTTTKDLPTEAVFRRDEEYYKSSNEEELELEESEVTDFDTACKLLTAAQSAEKLLLRKKDDLINKLVYENARPEKCENETDQRPTKRVLVTDLLAWNNEETSIEMLKHVFLHRNFEKDLSYCVADLLTSDRLQFRNAGTYEKDCIAFLAQCSDGNVKRATYLLQKHDINPDLCDAKGNTGIIYAASRDKNKMIKALVNFGAKVDVLNDECLTPLGICVARYLAVQQNVTEWEEAFLRKTSIRTEEEQEVREWRPHVSLSSMSSILQPQAEKSTENLGSNRPSKQSSPINLEVLSELFDSNLDVIQNNPFGSLSDVQHKLCKLQISPDFQEPYFPKIATETPQPYILSTECIKPPSEKKEKDKKEKKTKKGKKSKKEKKTKSLKSSEGSRKSDKPKKSNKVSKASKQLNKLSKTSVPTELNQTDEMKSEEELRNNKLAAIYDTIVTLLKYGADPNACEVPVPTLILAIFTKNLTLIEDLLRCKADLNITTLDEKLTALHVLVSLHPCEELVEILKLLLKYAADPNCRASVHHWFEQKMELVAQHQLEEGDEGKTPLHLLSMRYDFALDANEYLNQMVQILIEHGGKVKARYLGHTPLSLAIMRGNLKLIRTLLDTKRINPNQLLGEKMGVPLTLFILKRYQDILPDLNTCQDIIQLLLEYKANPFYRIEEFGNAIEFMFKEHEKPTKISKQENGKKGKGNKKTKSKGSGSRKSGRKDKKEEKGKNGKQIQEHVKRLLMTAAKTVLQKHIKGYAVKYLYFFVEEEDYYDDISANMAKFVTPEETIEVAQILVHRGEIPIDVSTNYEVMYDLVEFIINVNTQLENSAEPASAHVDIHRMLANFEFEKIPTERGKLNLPEPEAEQHSEKYNVCFHCYQKKDRQLFICPDCNLVYFCSQQCNALNNKEKDLVHKCGTLFYDRQKEIHEEELAKGRVWNRTSEGIKRLPETAIKKGWIQEPSQERYLCQKRQVEADPRRRLHLTRELRRLDSKSSPTKKVTTRKKPDLVSVSDTALRRKVGQRWGQNILNSKLPRQVSLENKEVMHIKQKHTAAALKGETYAKTSKSKEYFLIEEKGSKGKVRKGKYQSEFEESMAGRLGKRRNGKAKTGFEDRSPAESAKGKKHGAETKSEEGDAVAMHVGRAAAKDEGRKEAERNEEYDGGAKAKKDKKESKGKEKKEGRASAKGKVDGKEGKDEGESRGGAKGKNELVKFGTTALDKLALAGAEGLNLGPGTNFIKYTTMPAGGKILELQRRLPNKYQYFLEKISEYWPAFDLSMLFLPYACYSDGQLYYRFLSNKPVFMDTHSNN